MLGAILTNNKAYELCGALLPEHFADDVNREIYRAIGRRIESGRRVDAVTLLPMLENTGLIGLDRGGPGAYLAHLIASMVAINIAGEYAAAIRDCAVRRATIEACQDTIERAYGTELTDGDGQAAVSFGLNALEQAAAFGVGAGAFSMARAVGLAVAQAEEAARGTQRAVVTGIESLDLQWNGLFPGALELLGARSGSGKTSLALQISRNVASGGGHVGIFSLEVGARDLGTQNLASLSGVPADNIRRGLFSAAEALAVSRAQRVLEGLPIDIHDRPDTTLMEAIGEMRAMKRRKGTVLFVIDHRNLFARDPGWERASKLDWYQHITQRLKQAAKLLGVPILCLVQIGRGVMNREDARPRISDLEYAGEQDADNIVLLYRPELHMGEYPERTGRETAESHANKAAVWYARRAELAGITEAIFVKRRFGRLGTVQLRFDGPTTTFSDMPLHEELPPEQEGFL